MPRITGSDLISFYDYYTPKQVYLYLTTTSTTANQALTGSYTPTLGTQVIILEATAEAYFTTASETLTILGTFTLKWGTDVLKGPITAVNPTSGSPFGFSMSFPKGIAVLGDGSKSVNAVTTPAVTTSIKWIIDLLAIEKT